MDKNTFWSHTAPSYELIDYDDNADFMQHEIRGHISTTSADFKITAIGGFREEPAIEVRVFHTAKVEYKDRREKSFNWLNKKIST